jgi:hypothetical protein
VTARRPPDPGEFKSLGSRRAVPVVGILTNRQSRRKGTAYAATSTSTTTTSVAVVAVIVIERSSEIATPSRA